MSLEIGLGQGRMWDLNGCEYYWGLLPHLVQAFLLWLFSTTSIMPYRILNVLLGAVNSYLVFLVAKNNIGDRSGWYAGIIFGLFPIAVVFDAIAMQETLALFFALLSLYLFKVSPFWSGASLALASQSRTEFWLVSVIVIVVAVLVERASNRVFPLVLSWSMVTLAFCWFYASRTGNAFYPLYYELYNLFGGWSSGGEGKPLIALMANWIASKLSAWPTKPTGILILTSSFATIYVIVRMIRRRWETYHVHLYFIACLLIFVPLFVPYLARETLDLLLMLRMAIPIGASGSVALGYLSLKKGNIGGKRIPQILHPEKILILLMMASYVYFIPSYAQFEGYQLMAFTAADRAMDFYGGGTIVCDYPTMNYRFVNEWNVPATSLLGNHYSPAYYGSHEPIEFAMWLKKMNVTLWIHEGGARAETVLSVVVAEFPDLLVYRDGMFGIRIFTVNQTALAMIPPL